MSEEVIITDNRITVVDGEISSHMDFFCEIDESKKEIYIEELRQDVARKKEMANVPLPSIEISYDFARRLAYPPIGDQLDALFHAGVFPPEMAAQIQAVKDKYPKGS